MKRDDKSNTQAMTHVLLPFDHIDPSKYIHSADLRGDRRLNASLAFRLRRYTPTTKKSAFRKAENSAGSSDYKTVSTAGHHIDLNSRKAQFRKLLCVTDEDQVKVNASNQEDEKSESEVEIDDIVYDQSESHHSNEDRDGYRDREQEENATEPIDVQDVSALQSVPIIPTSLENIVVETPVEPPKPPPRIKTTKQMKEAFISEATEVLKTISYPKASLDTQKSPTSIRAVTKHPDIRSLLGWGPTLESQLEYIQSQQNTGTITVHLKKQQIRKQVKPAPVVLSKAPVFNPLQNIPKI